MKTFLDSAENRVRSAMIRNGIELNEKIIGPVCEEFNLEFVTSHNEPMFTFSDYIFPNGCPIFNPQLEDEHITEDGDFKPSYKEPEDFVPREVLELLEKLKPTTLFCDYLTFDIRYKKYTYKLMRTK